MSFINCGLASALSASTAPDRGAAPTGLPQSSTPPAEGSFRRLGSRLSHQSGGTGVVYACGLVCPSRFMLFCVGHSHYLQRPTRAGRIQRIEWTESRRKRLWRVCHSPSPKAAAPPPWNACARRAILIAPAIRAHASTSGADCAKWVYDPSRLLRLERTACPLATPTRSPDTAMISRFNSAGNRITSRHDLIDRGSGLAAPAIWRKFTIMYPRRPTEPMRRNRAGMIARTSMRPKSSRAPSAPARCSMISMAMSPSSMTSKAMAVSAI